MANIQLINDWVSDYKRLDISSSSQLHNYSISVTNHPELIHAIYNVLEDEKYHPEFLEATCHQLFNFYRSKEENLRVFALMFLPTFIGIHLTNYQNTDSTRKLYLCVDVFLLGIYNLEVVTDDGTPVRRTFRIPILAKPSVYHEPLSSAQQPQSALTEHALHKLESGVNDMTISAFGPYNGYEQITASSRMTIMTVLLKIYNEQLSSQPKQSLAALCRMAVKVLRHGGGQKTNIGIISKKYSGAEDAYKSINYTELISKNSYRIPFSSTFLVELVNSVYFCMFNDVSLPGLQALDEIHKKALSSLYADVLLMTNAIKNSLKINSAGETNNGSMEINVALSPTSNSTNISNSGISKAAITNASFRTRKLPDDIPIVTVTQTANSAAATTVPLMAINEEEEDNTDKTIKSVQSHPKNLTPSSKVLQLLSKDRKEKKKENATVKSKLKENGDFAHKQMNNNEELSETVNSEAIITETPDTSRFGAEKDDISLKTFKTIKSLGDDEVSNCSSNISGDAASSVPLMNITETYNLSN